jgi:hypothetical protein
MLSITSSVEIHALVICMSYDQAPALASLVHWILYNPLWTSNHPFELLTATHTFRQWDIRCWHLVICPGLQKKEGKVRYCRLKSGITSKQVGICECITRQGTQNRVCTILLEYDRGSYPYYKLLDREENEKRERERRRGTRPFLGRRCPKILLFHLMTNVLPLLLLYNPMFHPATCPHTCRHIIRRRLPQATSR